MTDNGEGNRAQREAAEWLARLNVRQVDQETLDAFFAWRRVPGHAEAYDEVETIWTSAERLGDERDIAIAVRDALARPRWRRRWMVLEGALRQRPSYAALIVLCLCLFVLGGWAWTSQGDAYATAIGEQRLVQLADGSSVRLDTDTRIRVRLSHASRRVDLIGGQALFAVAHDADRPFVVRVGDARITAVGTRFDIDSAQDGGPSVALVEGRLSLSATASDDRPVDLLAGSGATFDNSGWSQPHQIDADAVTSWTTGRLRFSETPLATAVATMNRYTSHRIILADAELAETRVSGTFDTDDVAGFVTAIAKLYGLHAATQPDGTIHLSR